MFPRIEFLRRRPLRRFVSLAAFFASLITYILTLDSDASFWDCPEYLVTSALLEVGHPPGNPVWTLTTHIFAMFGGADPQAIAIAVNLSSALFTALACGILASLIFLTLQWVYHSDISPSTSPRRRRLFNLATALSALSGALCFGWMDSTWFSAVEAEVYAMSLFLTALSMRLMVGWALRRNRAAARRELLLIVYLTGLSIGVHQLNLLVIPALAFIWLFHRYKAPAGWGKILLTLLISCAAVGAILLGMMPGVIKLAGYMELLCVNHLHLPFHSGVVAFWTLALGLCWIAPIFLQRCHRIHYRWVMLSWVPAMLLTGYGSYMLILVRGAANPPMNEAAPSDIFALSSYLGRDQYGSTPLFYGRTPYSRPMRLETVNPDGSRDYSHTARKRKSARYAPVSPDSGYRLYDYNWEILYTPELNMWFPRLTSSDPADISCYADWAGMRPEAMESVEISYAFDAEGNPVGQWNPDAATDSTRSRFREKEMRPTYLQNFRYLTAYQIGYMYMRYLMWNLAGKQNDRFATGEAEHGNFITGFSPLDNAMLGDQSRLPAEIGAQNPGHNRYFLLPLLAGILGMVLLQQYGRRRGGRVNTVVLMLFLMTGVAIVVYLNQTPREPRERDYSFLGSFWAYAIWIGAGMMAIMRGALRMKLTHSFWQPLRRFIPIIRNATFAAGAAFAIFLPIWMLCENYDDHDRSGRRVVSDYSANLLESLEPNAILFTNGDNFTFPLWWAQEVGGVRRDVTIVNLAYLATPWYVGQMQTSTPGHPGLEMQARMEDIRFGQHEFTPYERTHTLPSFADTLRAADAITALRELYNGQRKSLPAMLRLANPEGGDSLYIRSQAVASASSSINFKRLALIDILSSNAASATPRPVYWQASMPGGDFAGLYPFSARTLNTRRLVYTDSLDSSRRTALLDFDLACALSVRDGGASGQGGRAIYADATVGPMITQQRLGMLRLGGRLLREGRREDALAVAHSVMRNFPASTWEYQIFNETDSACNEGLDLARLLLEGALPRGRESADYQAGLQLLRREQQRFYEWQRYRRSLPAHLQPVLSPKNLRKATRLPQLADSLLRQYSRK